MSPPFNNWGWSYRIQDILVGMPIGVFLFMIVLSFIGPFGPDDSKIPKKACPDPLIEMAEYKTVVHSLDRCNERLWEVNNILEENDYVYQQMEVVERFQPDTSEAESIQICRECSDLCEERLFWCYYYRDEACICDDIVE